MPEPPPNPAATPPRTHRSLSEDSGETIPAWEAPLRHASPRLTLFVGGVCGVCVCFAASSLVLISCYALQPLPEKLPSGLVPLFEVATGFAWAENLVCVRRNATLDPARAASLFVTDNQRGDLVRVDWHARGQQAGHYSLPIVHPASYDFSLMAGIAYNRRTGELFVLANARGVREREHCVLVRVDAFADPAAAPEDTYEIVAALERKCVGDGLAVDEETGLLYAASQGAFVPRLGAVFELDPASGRVVPVISGAFGSDGAFIDQRRRLLYVTEFLSPTHSVLVYDLAARALVGRIHPRGVRALDDFTLSRDGSAILAADFLGGAGVVFATGVTARASRPAWSRVRTELASTILSGVSVPTTIRRGCSPDRQSGFNDELLFIAEGGGLSAETNDRRILAFALPEGEGHASARSRLRAEAEAARAGRLQRWWWNE